MKLVRFELIDAPGNLRSGLVYEDRVYETDGEKAIGIHEFGKIRLHAPVGPVAGFRIFEKAKGDELTYRHAHPYNLHGPLAEVEMPSEVDGLDFDAHVCVVLQDGGSQVDSSEAKSFVLGYSLALVFRIPAVVEEDQNLGGTGAIGKDVGAVLGPFLVTPEDLTDQFLPNAPTIMRLPYEITVNGEMVQDGILDVEPGVEVIIPQASRYSRVFASEALAWPAVAKPELEFSALGRLLLPSDRVSFKVEGLGTLVARVG